MKTSRFLAYASLIIVLTAGAIWYIVSDYYQQQASDTAKIMMYKNAGCKCCDKWASYMRSNGFSVDVQKSSNMQQIKDGYGIPADMRSCHTAVIGNYIVEGHVPAEDVRRMLQNKPDAAGIAAPGMPASSPGMNTKLNEPYTVFLFKRNGDRAVYAKH